MFSLNERINTKATTARVRKTGRGQRLMSVLGMVLLGVFLFVELNQSTASAASENQRYVVQAGDTLWSISTHMASNRDVRDVLGKIENLNQLDSSADIYPGQVLMVPAK